jgi:hypothetical protein
MSYLHGNHFSASSLDISGSTVDVIETVKTLTGKDSIIVKKLFISNGSVVNKVMLNGNTYWSDLLLTSGSYSLNFEAGDVLISKLYMQNSTGSKLVLDLIY